jgi:hypothetical protein
MSLAALFLFSAFSMLLSPFLGPIPALQSAPPSSTSASETPAQEAPSSTNSTNSQPSSQASTTQTPSAAKSAPPKVQTGKKKLASQGCNASPAPAPEMPSGAPASQPANQPASAPSADAGEAGAAKPTPPQSCPPAKIIVRQGGTTEPRIRLAGGPTAAEAARKRDAVNQLLGATNQNLKKTAGWQLSSSQRDTITQTRQFMEQSKAAMADGDVERARTLAWKAQLLSEDLVNPQK